MLGRMIRKSLFKNVRITIWTLLTLTTFASLVTMFTTISFDVGGKMSGTLRQLGANAIAYSDSNIIEQNNLASWQLLGKIAKQEGVEVLQLYVRIGTINGKPIAVVIADPEKLSRMMPYWAISGRPAVRLDECLIGRRVAELLQLKSKMTVNIQWIAGTDEKTDCRITGIFDSGDEDENRMFIPIPSTESIQSTIKYGSPQSVFTYALLSIPDSEEGIERLNGRLRAVQDKVEVKPLRQILYGEKTTLKKVTLLSGLSLLAVLILTSLGVSSAVLARIVERRKELALMQALGATHWSVVSFLILESAIVGVVASISGFSIGTLMSQVIVQKIFHVSVTSHLAAFLITLLITIGVALLAGCIGAVRALRIQPAIVLKGE